MKDEKETTIAEYALPSKQMVVSNYNGSDIACITSLQILYEKLSAAFPQDAIQRTKKEDTKKGYDTTGIGYQYCVNRFNEIIGLEAWGYDYHIIKELEGTFSTGKPFFDITVEVSIWLFRRENVRKCVGGHLSSFYGDALKGAITNGFKKTSAYWGVGRQAYEGTLDDDAVIEGDVKERKPQKEKPSQSRGLLSLEELEAKMQTAVNVFELKGRWEKYRPDYNALKPEDRVAVQREKDKRKVELDKIEKTQEGVVNG